jgi:hypothetical protein
MAYLKCNNCNYRSLEIDEPHGLPKGLVIRAIQMHTLCYKNHTMVVIDGEKK